MVNLDKIREKLQKLNQRGGGGSSDKFFKPAEGKNQVRILPYETKEEGIPFLEVSNHQISENGQTKYVNCIFKSSKGEISCPICKVYFDLWKLADADKNEELKKFASDHRGKLRVLYNIIDRADGKVKVMSVGKKLHEQIGSSCCDSDYGYDEEAGTTEFFDLEKGYDMVIEKETVAGRYPNYDKSKPRKNPSKALEEGDINSIIEQMHVLEDEVKEISVEELQKYADMILVQASKMMGDVPWEDENPDGAQEEDNSMNYSDHLDKLKGAE